MLERSCMSSEKIISLDDERILGEQLSFSAAALYRLLLLQCHQCPFA